MSLVVAGEIAIKSQPQDLGPFATTIVERLVPILAAPAGSMPRSIIENRSAAPPQRPAGALDCRPGAPPGRFQTAESSADGQQLPNMEAQAACLRARTALCIAVRERECLVAVRSRWDAWPGCAQSPSRRTWSTLLACGAPRCAASGTTWRRSTPSWASPPCSASTLRQAPAQLPSDRPPPLCSVRP